MGWRETKLQFIIMHIVTSCVTVTTRAHTLRALQPLWPLWAVAALHVHVCTPWLGDPYLHRGRACAVKSSQHMEWVQPVTTDMLNGKCTIYSTSEPCSAIWSVQKPVFHQYLPIRGSYSMHRCLELEIWRFSWQRRQTTDKTDCFTPCTCTQGNYVYSWIYYNRNSQLQTPLGPQN